MPRRIFLFGVLLLVLAAAYTAASAWMTFVRVDQLQREGQSAVKSQQIRTALNAFLVAVLDVESSSRGFTLSGDAAMLVPFEAGRRQVPALLDELRDLLRSNPVQLARVQQLVPLVAEHIAISELAIARRRSLPDENAGARHAGDGEAGAIVGIRRIVDEIDADERRDLADRKIQWGRELDRARETEIVSVLSSFFVIMLSGWALIRLRRYAPPGAPDLREVPGATAGFAADPAMAAAVFAAPQCGVGARLHDALTHTEVARDAFERGSRDWARLDVLRQGLRDALDRHERVVEEMALPAMQRAGLAISLQSMLDGYRRLGLFKLRESIDFSLRLANTGHAHLLYQAAEWALEILAHRAAGCEVNVGLTGAPDAFILRVVSTHRQAVELTPGEQQAAASIVIALRHDGGTWQWQCDAEGARLTVTLGRDQPDGDSSVASSNG